jgi:transcription initiation factor TFIIIB Brf1 subunit/transcription initiation factor TFIIB
MELYSSYYKISKKEIGSSLKDVQIELKLTKNEDYGSSLNRYCSNLKLQTKIQRYSEEVLNNLIIKGLASGRNPNTVASASIYLVCQHLGENLSLSDLSGVTSMGENTIKHYFKEIYEKKDELLPKEILKINNEI